MATERHIINSFLRGSPTTVGTYSLDMGYTGKERDAETGYSYFGARYYDSDLNGLFLSVDPMSDKYPSLSPYVYCAWNPVKLVDPDGMEINPVYGSDGTFRVVRQKALLEK